MQLWVQLHDHPEHFFVGGHRPPQLWEAMEPGGKPGSCFAGEGPPSWQQQTGCKPHLAADALHRRSFRALHSGVFFSYLIGMGGGCCFNISELSEPLAQRQDASFRQRRLDHQGRMRLPSHQLMKPCSCVIVYNHPVHSAQQCTPAMYQLPVMG